MKVRQNILNRLTDRVDLKRLPLNFRRQRQPKLGGSCNELVATAEVLTSATIAGSRDLGIQDVPVKQIVGSGRWRDFDLSFQLKREDVDGRWQRQAETFNKGITLKPVHLLKIGGRYFVVDGNHRISVAQTLGQSEIKAKVIELEVTNIQQSSDCQRLGFRINSQNACLKTENC